MVRVGVLSIVQESNTFAPRPTTLADFESQGLYRGADAASRMAGTNTELAGAVAELERRGVTPVPLARAWAMSGGRLEAEALEALAREAIGEAGPLAGLMLSLHGAMAAEGVDSADAVLAEAARAAVGDGPPIGVCLDLHANVTAALLRHVDFVIGYKTYPHVDQAATGARATGMLADLIAGASRPRTVLAKRPMILPAETTQTTDGPMGAFRRMADRLARPPVLDISIFPVQPWLDVADLGFGVTVTVDTISTEVGRGDPNDAKADAQVLAEDLASIAWHMRRSFAVALVAPENAVRAARARTGQGPLLVSESADSPTAGASADSPAVIEAILRDGGGLRSLVTLVDPPAVARCTEAGAGATVELLIGASIDPRFHRPVRISGRVDRVGATAVRLGGPAFEGIEVSLGRCAVLSHDGLSILLTERPAPTFDPAAYRSVGLEPAGADLVAVRSANLFRAGWAGIADEAVILDLPGASTPRLDRLRFERAPRPLWPVDDA